MWFDARILRPVGVIRHQIYVSQFAILVIPFSYLGDKMATTTSNPETHTPEIAPETKSLPVNLTENAISKVKEIMAQQDPVPAGLRIGVVGGGCSRFAYH